jgi:hypothetical protein
MEQLFNSASLNDWGPKTFVALIILMILTDQLVLKTRLKKVEKERDEWKNIALGLLGVANRAVVANETAVKTIDARLPPTELVAEVFEKVIGPDQGQGRRKT